jgi:hypothetical protein
VNIESIINTELEHCCHEKATIIMAIEKRRGFNNILNNGEGGDDSQVSSALPRKFGQIISGSQREYKRMTILDVYLHMQDRLNCSGPW